MVSYNKTYTFNEFVNLLINYRNIVTERTFNLNVINKYYTKNNTFVYYFKNKQGTRDRDRDHIKDDLYLLLSLDKPESSLFY